MYNVARVVATKPHEILKFYQFFRVVKTRIYFVVRAVDTVSSVNSRTTTVSKSENFDKMKILSFLLLLEVAVT